MFTTPRIFAASLLATLASALPSKLPELPQNQDLNIVRRATAEVYTQCFAPDTVAITFDDGPYIYNTDIVNILKDYNATATFFVNGNNYECIYSPENEERLKAHRDWTTLSHDELMSEMTRTDEALMKILGVKPAFVRPPYGKYNDRSEQVAEENGQSIVIWDFDSRDSIGASPDESKEEYRKVADKRPPTILTLNHETYETTAHDVLPYALDILRDNGYNFVSVAECLGGMEPYAKRTDPAVRDDSWTC